jgi:hypothetical protein
MMRALKSCTKARGKMYESCTRKRTTPKT